jgi:hypothetical protein
MAKANSSENATESLKKTLDTASHLDARGRLITVGRTSALQFYRLTKAMGVTASNEASMALASLVATVRKIDATNVAFPSTESEVEFLIQQLDFDGIAGVGEALVKLRENAIDEAAVAKN